MSLVKCIVYIWNKYILWKLGIHLGEYIVVRIKLLIFLYRSNGNVYATR